jgi:hypothetical protein
VDKALSKRLCGACYWLVRSQSARLSSLCFGFKEKAFQASRAAFALVIVVQIYNKIKNCLRIATFAKVAAEVYFTDFVTVFAA